MEGGRHAPRRAAHLMAGAALLWAAILYQPWRDRPFAIQDYSEFLPFLQRGSSFGGQLAAVMSYFESQGRSAFLTYVFIVANWAAFGPNNVGWVALRFAIMCALVFAVFVLLIRLGSSWRAAALGASLFIWTEPAASNWIRLTTEPLGTLLVCAALLLALEYGDTPKWRRLAAGIALAVGLAILVKETFVALAPVVIAAAATARRDSSGSVPLARRLRFLSVLVTGTTLVLLVPIVWAATHVQPGRYVASYGKSAFDFAGFLARTFRILLLIHPSGGALAIGAGLLVGVLAVAGSYFVARISSHKRRFAPALFLGIALVLAGAVIYVPWPRFEPFYALPFLVGTAILVATSLTALEAEAPSLARGMMVAVVAAAGCGSVATYGLARYADALASANAAVARVLVQQTSALDSAIVLSGNTPEQPWQGLGPTLERYARAVTGRRALHTVDVNCRAQPWAHESRVPRALVISYVTPCGALEAPTSELRIPYRRVDYRSLHVRTDTLRVQVRKD